MYEDESVDEGVGVWVALFGFCVGLGLGCSEGQGEK